MLVRRLGIGGFRCGGSVTDPACAEAQSLIRDDQIRKSADVITTTIYEEASNPHTERPPFIMLLMKGAVNCAGGDDGRGCSGCG